MKKIKLKFYGLGYNNLCQALVYIYDNHNNLIYSGQTYNSEIYISLNKNRIYRIVATSLGERIDTNIFIGNNYEYCLIFNRSLIPINNPSEDTPITFLLTDYYYSNLPIERGDLILWQR